MLFIQWFLACGLWTSSISCIWKLRNANFRPPQPRPTKPETLGLSHLCLTSPPRDSDTRQNLRITVLILIAALEAGREVHNIPILCVEELRLRGLGSLPVVTQMVSGRLRVGVHVLIQFPCTRPTWFHIQYLHSGGREVDLRTQMEGMIAVYFYREREKAEYCRHCFPLGICCSFQHCSGVFYIYPKLGKSRLRGSSAQICFLVLKGSWQCKCPRGPFCTGLFGV